MTHIHFTSEMNVKLVRATASDEMVVQAARVSVIGENEGVKNPVRDRGLVRYLMKNRHGSPFEHNSMTFFIQAPIFVFREFHRHRIGWSYNEESGRYKELDPLFYIPRRERHLVQVGKPGSYELKDGSPDQFELVRSRFVEQYTAAYETYIDLCIAGVCREVARDVLPVGIYSSMYATCNARSLMSFLSLRTRAEHALNESRPLREIEMVAEKMEKKFEILMPNTYEAWNDGGRVAP